jgi:glycosyltransferase involved in cell wall biosynthesis
LKIHHFNTESGGGAHSYAQRLSDVLNGIGHESVLHTKLADAGGMCGASGMSRWLQRGRYSLENRMLVADSPSYFSRLAEFHHTPAPQSGIDVAHLHWIGRWLDLGSFVRSLPPDVPVVWTVHDMSPLAGGCFTDFGCGEFGHGCRKCPLVKGPLKLLWARQELRRRAAILRGRRVAFVANSESTLQLVKKSELAAGHHVEAIPPGFNFTELQTRDKSAAKARWGLLPDAFVLGFVAASLTDENKGFSRFQEVARKVGREIPNTIALLVGDGIPGQSVPSVKTGLLADVSEMNCAYAAMDALVVPSRMESFGQVSVEAQACGTPVWAFAVGGLPETLENGVTGGLAQFGETGVLAAGIVAAKQNGLLPKMAEEACRQSRQKFGHENFARRYTDLYAKLYEKSPGLEF